MIEHNPFEYNPSTYNKYHTRSPSLAGNGTGTQAFALA